MRGWTVLSIFTVLLVATGWLLPASAQVCAPAPGYDIAWIGRGDGMDRESNCSRFSLYSHCYEAEPLGPRYEVTPADCDPEVETCGVRGVLPIDLPGNHQNPFEPCCTPAQIEWLDSGGGSVAFCGFSFAQIRDGEGDARITGGGFSCADPDGLEDGDVYTLIITTCPADAFGCEKEVEATLDFTPAPPPASCSGDADCRTCVPASGTGAGGGSGGGASVGGGGASAAPPVAGPPGLDLSYLAGGVGFPDLPGSAAESTALGRGWSHAFAERIVVDPDESHVWLLTRHATFHSFIDGDGDGVYEAATPSDEYRTLTWLGAGLGWELRDLDGTVASFADDGLWSSTVDRNGNATVATRDGGGLLTSVDLPDGRSLTFTHAGGLLETATEVGLDGTTTRTWSYTWTGEDLARIDRPDGTAWILGYDDTRHPGYLTELTLEGDDGTSTRLVQGWAYDATGNAVQLWRGDSQAGADGLGYGARVFPEGAAILERSR